MHTTHTSRVKVVGRKRTASAAWGMGPMLLPRAATAYAEPGKPRTKRKDHNRDGSGARTQDARTSPSPKRNIGARVGRKRIPSQTTTTSSTGGAVRHAPVRAVEVPALQAHTARLQHVVFGEDGVAELAAQALGLAAEHDVQAGEVRQEVHLPPARRTAKAGWHA